VAPSELDAALARHYGGPLPVPPPAPPPAPAPAPAADPREPRRAHPEDPEFLHHWSVSREEVLALLAEDPAVVAEEGASQRGASEIRAALDRRRLNELD